VKILIVEDERQLSEVLAALLKQNLHETDAILAEYYGFTEET
jgi:DNA-binding response OmpR family regulator